MVAEGAFLTPEQGFRGRRFMHPRLM